MPKDIFERFGWTAENEMIEKELHWIDNALAAIKTLISSLLSDIITSGHARTTQQT